MASLMHRFIVMHSASIVDCATVCCRLLFHETTSSPTQNTYLDVDHWFSTSPVQSASEYLWHWYVGLLCAILYPRCPSKSTKFDRHPMHWIRFEHILIYHTYRKCEVRSYGHHSVHQRSHCLLVRNVLHFVQMIFVLLIWKLRQRGHCIERVCDGLTIRHAEGLQNALDVASLMHGDGAGFSIPLEMNTGKEMRFVEVAHLEFTLEASLQLVDIYIYNHKS